MLKPAEFMPLNHSNMITNYMDPCHSRIPGMQPCGDALKCETSGISEPSPPSLHTDDVISSDEKQIAELVECLCPSIERI